MTANDEKLKSPLKFLSDEFGIEEKIWEEFAFYFKGDELWFSSLDWIKFLTTDFSLINKNFKHHLLSSLVQVASNKTMYLKIYNDGTDSTLGVNLSLGSGSAFSLSRTMVMGHLEQELIMGLEVILLVLLLEI